MLCVVRSPILHQPAAAAEAKVMAKVLEPGIQGIECKMSSAMKKRPEGSRDRVGGRKGSSVYPWENRAAKEQERGVNNAPTTRMHTSDFL